jgi:hypothetical protein
MSEPEEKKTGSTDERPYDEALWRRGQELYFKLLDADAGKSRPDGQLVVEGRKFCEEAEQLLRSRLEDYDDFVQRVMISEKFYSDAARVKKSELYFKQLLFRKNRIESLVRRLAR